MHRLPDSDSQSTLPPFDESAEAGVLGCILLANGEAVGCFRRLGGDHFYDLRHKEVFHALRRLDAEGKPLDPVNLYQWLRDNNRVEDAGGFDYIQRLPDAAASATQFES